MSRALAYLLAGTLGLMLYPRATAAESALVLPLPDSFGEIEAGTYDEAGKRVGDAQLRVEQLQGGDVRLEARSGIDGSASMVVTAELRPTPDGRGLRLVSQTSQSRDESGNALGRLAIDHLRRQASCTAPTQGAEPQILELPSRDRVVNVPHNLLFQSLAKGEAEEIRFQLLVCRSGARLIDAKATVAEGSEGIVEVRYDMELGPLLSRLAAPFLPRLSVWFDPAADGGWVGQRFPLFTSGPTVIVVRTGFDDELLPVR